MQLLIARIILSRMDTHPYHHYLFFAVSKSFSRETREKKEAIKKEFQDFLEHADRVIVVPYTTLGFKTNTTFMLWCRTKNPSDAQDMLKELLRTPFGEYLTLTYSYFGIVRNSPYSGRTGKPEQVMQNYEDRLPYF